MAVLVQPGDLLIVDGLSTVFETAEGTVRAADGVSFSVGRGRTLGLVGESGCGKSVTARSIMRLVDPPGHILPGSRIEFDGRDLLGLGEAAMRDLRGRELSMIFQEPTTSLNPVYPVGDQVAEAIRQHLRVSRREAAARTVEMFRLVGIPSPESRVHAYPHELSGGMQQRVMIAMALSCEPKLLIADEPTTALDVTIQAQILDLLGHLQERLHMSLLLITHDLGVIAEMADVVAVMYAGRVVERGATADVFEHPRHPYTAALLQSIPRLGLDAGRPLRVIRGMIPSPHDWPPGCRFAPRCDHAFERCRREEPALEPAGPQVAACWLNETGERWPAPLLPRS